MTNQLSGNKRDAIIFIPSSGEWPDLFPHAIRGRFAILVGIVTLISILVCAILIYSNQMVPRLTAAEHTAELCKVLQHHTDTLVGAWRGGDVSHLPEIFSDSKAQEEAKLILHLHEQGQADMSIVQILRCKATYYTPEKLEIEAAERVWSRTVNKSTGELTDPRSTNPFFLNMARESEFAMVFVKDDGIWKFQTSTETTWKIVQVEPP